MKLGKSKPYNLFNGDAFEFMKELPDKSVDLVFTSPPYCMGKEYEKSRHYKDFLVEHERIFDDIYRITKDGGSICWQIGYHVNNNSIMPLDWLVYEAIKPYLEDKRLTLRNRINWQFGHGFHNEKRFSGRHEVILWFTKGENYTFNLDSVRIPQKYPGKKHSKGAKKGEYSGNPLGKNPGDVWDIPNVKAHHVEKTTHPCQFPVALVQRFVKAVVPKEGIVFDPFMGSGSTGVATLLEHRYFIGSEISKKYFTVATERCGDAVSGKAIYREDKPIYKPEGNLSVTKKPDFFRY